MHGRMQRLDPTVQDLGRTGDGADLDHREPGLAQRARPCRRSRPARPPSPAARGASSTRPVLSWTESRARRIGRRGIRRLRMISCGGASRAMKKPSSPPDARELAGQGAHLAGGREVDRQALQLGRADRVALDRRVRRRAAPRSAAALPRAAASRRRRPACRRARRSRTAASSSRACASASRSTSAGDFAQGTSGWRRMVPVAVQGASSRTRVEGRRRPATRARRRPRSRRRASAGRDCAPGTRRAAASARAR